MVPVAPPIPSAGPLALVAGALSGVAVHVVLFAALGFLDPGDLLRRRPQTVEMEVIEKPPPPPPKVVVRRIVAKAPPPLPPPPPNQEPPPTPPPEPPAPPVFGVTMDSVVTGDSNVAVPVGSTLMTKDRTPGRPAPPAPVAVTEAPSFAPVAETSIGEFPRTLHEETGEGYYPGEARRLGMEGQVVMRVGIDRRGSVRSVRVIKPAGYGFDEAATRAMWKFKFSPAKTREGEPVDFLITYKYTFKPPR